MTTKSNAVLSNTTPTSPMFDEKKTGPMTWAWLKFFQNIRTIINNTFNVQGQIVGPIAPGVVVGNTDNLTDGTGHPLAGGKEAYTALVTSSPTSGQVLQWNGTDWVPFTLPAAPVTKIIAGTGGVSITPPTGLGDVTINIPPVVAGYSLGGALTTANVVLGPGAGTGAVLNAVAGLDGNHQIQVTTGTSPVANGVVFTVTFTATRGHVTYPIIKCVVVAVGHSPIDISPGATASATSYQAFNTGLDPSTSYDWNVSCP